jgi:2-C-methyl-D-erythritol 4-phosphate cytidylyltransferase
MKKAAGIILAGGKGFRFGSQKQFLQINGKELWKHVLDKLSINVAREDIVVVGVDIEGGITRSQSVINGLNFLEQKKKNYERVIILEAARPLITNEQIQQILQDEHDSATFVLPLKSTIIKKDGTYLNRSDYYKLSTPVAFNYPLFYQAYTSGKYFDYTDDTRIMYEHYGIKPYFLAGGENMFKLTYKSDVAILEMLMEKYSL